MTDGKDEELEIKMIEDTKKLEKPQIQQESGGLDYAPEDDSSVVYWSFMYLGACILLPWSAVLNTLDFFIAEM